MRKTKQGLRRKNFRAVNSRAIRAALWGASAAAGMGLFSQRPVLATTLTWDPSQSPTTASDGGGIWNTTGSNYWSNGTTDVAWATGDLASFGVGGTAGTVNLAVNISTAGLIFNNTAAISTSATWTAGTSSITVGSASGLAVGQVVSGTGIPAGAFITAISGTTVTLSQPPLSGTGGTVSTESQYTISRSSGTGTLTLATTNTINIANGQSATIAVPIGGTIGLETTGQGNLVLNGANGANVYTGTTTLQAGTLTLDYTHSTVATNLIAAASPLSLAGGNLYVNTSSSSNTQAFASTGLVAGASSSVSVVGGGSVALGALTIGAGSSVVFNGPATINASGNVAATGTITTATAGVAGTAPVNGGVLASGANNNSYATVGLYDWATTDTTAAGAGTSPYTIIGGSQVTGFYFAEPNNNTPTNDENLDISVQQTPTGPGGTGEVRFASGTVYTDTIRFNSSHAPEITVKSGAFFETGGILVTPNMGTVNAAIDGLRITSIGTQIVQNNTNGVLITGNNNGVGFYSAANSTAENIVKSGAGTWFVDPTTNNLALNYYTSGNVYTLVNTTSYNYSNSASSSYFGLYLNGGVTVINNANVLGNPTSQASTFGAGGSVNENGGWLMADVNSSVNLVNAAAANANRPVWLGGNGGGLAAATGTTFTVDGLIESNNGGGALIIGIPASSANNYTAGLVPGTGSGTANAALYATGTVVLNGSGNGYIGGTVIDSGILNINGIYALGGGVYGGLTLNGGTLQYSSTFSPTALGGGDVTAYGTSVGSLSIGAGGGTVDLNGSAVTYASVIHNAGGGALNVTSSDGNHAGVLTLSANSSLPGGINLYTGGLVVNGTLSGTTPLAVQTGGTLSGTGSAGEVTLTSGGTISTASASAKLSMTSLSAGAGTFAVGVGSSSAGSISTGNATFTATPNFAFTITGSPTAGSNFVILQSANAINDGGFLGSLTPENIGRLTLTPTYNASADDITVDITGSPATLYWNPGSSNNNWDVQTTKNFNNAGTADYFYAADNVNFTDTNSTNLGTGTNATPYTVNIPGSVSPGSVTVNASGNYIFTGAGTITGGASLVKSGSGSLSLGTTNTYTGGTLISAGTLALGGANVLPTTGTISLSGTGELDLAGNSQTTGTVTDAGNTTDGVTNSSTAATLTINDTTAGTIGGVISGNVALTFSGLSNETLSGNNTYTGLTSVTAGTLIAASNNALGSTASTTEGLSMSGTAAVDFTSSAPAIASLAGASTDTIVLGNTTTPAATTLTVGAAGLTTTFAGVISDLSGTNAAAVGNLATTGSGELILSGANTFTGTTVVGGTSTLLLNNAAALQDSTLNYNNQGGNISFGTLTAATLGGLTGSEGLALANASAANITLTVGNGGASTVYSGSLSGGGALAKSGAGTFTLSAANSYTGYTNVNAGTLAVTGAIGSSASPTGAVTVQGGTLSISGGAVYAATATVGLNATNSFALLTNGGAFATTGTLNFNSATGSEESFPASSVELLSGVGSFSSVVVGRSGDNFATTIQTSTPINDAIYVNGATVNIATTLGVGAQAGTNSSSLFHQDSGSTTVGGLTTVTATSSNRLSVLDLNGGNFTATGGIQLGGLFAISDGELLVRGTAVLNTASIALDDASQTSGLDAVELIGGTTYVGSGGIYANTGTGTLTVNLGSSAVTTAPILAASAPWSSTLNMTLTNSSGAAGPVIQAADAFGNANNITLSGVLSGAGRLNKAGAGALILSNVNTYTGGTAISAGTLYVNNSATGSGTGSGSLSVTGGTLAGAGTISGAVSVASGATVSPGSLANAQATLSTGATTFVDSSTFAITIDSDTGTGGRLAVNGAATFGSSSGVLLSVTDLGAGTNPALAGEVITIVTGSSPVSGLFANLNASNQIVASNGLTYGVTFNDTSSGAADPGENITLTLDSVPEPGSLGLLGLGGLGLIRRRRRAVAGREVQKV